MLLTCIHIIENNVIVMYEKQFEEPPVTLDKIVNKIVDAAYKVHLNKGPGLLERFYRDALIIEIKKKGLKVEKEVHMPVYYDDVRLEGDYILDLIVEEQIVVELKTVEQLTPLHKAQLRTYLDISGCRLGLLVNFNCILIKDNIRRVIR
jgi:GxxExxY protein